MFIDSNMTANSKLVQSSAKLNIIDMKSLADWKYSYIFCYQDSASKMLILHAVESNKPQHVATVLHDILHLVGFPSVIRSESGHVFVTRVLQEMRILWGTCSSSLNSTQREDVSNYPRAAAAAAAGEEGEDSCNDDDSMINNVYVLESLKCWMIQHNSSNWSLGVKLVQFQENSINQNVNIDFVSSDKLLTELAGIYMPFECLKSLKSNDELNQILCRTLTTGIEDLQSQLGVSPKRTVCCRPLTAKPHGKHTNGCVADKKFQFERSVTTSHSDLVTSVYCGRKPRLVATEESSEKESLPESRLSGSVDRDSDVNSVTAAATRNPLPQDLSYGFHENFSHSDIQATRSKSQLYCSTGSGALEKPSTEIVAVPSNSPDTHLHHHHHHQYSHLPLPQQPEHFLEALSNDGDSRCNFSRCSAKRVQDFRCHSKCVRDIVEFMELKSYQHHNNSISLTVEEKSQNHSSDDSASFSHDRNCGPCETLGQPLPDILARVTGLADLGNRTLDHDLVSPGQIVARSCLDIGQLSLDKEVDNATPAQMVLHVQRISAPTDVSKEGKITCRKEITEGALNCAGAASNYTEGASTETPPSVNVGEPCFVYSTKWSMPKTFVALSRSSSLSEINSPMSCTSMPPRRIAAPHCTAEIQSPVDPIIVQSEMKPPALNGTLDNSYESSPASEPQLPGKFEDSQCLVKVRDIIKKLEISNSKCLECEDFTKNRKIPERTANIGNIIKRLESFAGPHPKWRTLRIIGQSCEDLNNLDKDCDVDGGCTDGSVVRENTSSLDDDKAEDAQLSQCVLSVGLLDTGLASNDADDRSSSPDYRSLTHKDSNQTTLFTDVYDNGDGEGHDGPYRGKDDDDDDIYSDDGPDKMEYIDEGKNPKERHFSSCSTLKLSDSEDLLNSFPCNNSDDNNDDDDDDTFTYTEELDQRINTVIFRLKSESEVSDCLDDKDPGECCEDSSVDGGGGGSENTAAAADDISVSQETCSRGNESIDTDHVDPATLTDTDPPQCFVNKLSSSPSCYNLNSYVATSYFCNGSREGAADIKPNICKRFDVVSNSTPLNDKEHTSLNRVHDSPVGSSSRSSGLECSARQQPGTCTTVIRTPSWYVPSYENPKQITNNADDDHGKMSFLTDIEQKIKQALQELEAVDLCRYQSSVDDLCPASTLYSEGGGQTSQCKQCKCNDEASYCKNCNCALEHQLQDHCYMFSPLCRFFNKRLVGTQEQFHYQVYEKRTILRGKSFYAIETKPYCESCYVNTLEKCSVCSKPVIDRLLRATGKPYHPSCFTCVVCGKSLDGVPFTVDATNQIHCIDDFHKKFAPRCCVCQLPIMPDPGKEETVRVVAMDRSFHVHCYCCEDCGMLLSSEAEGRGCYPLDEHILCKICNAKRIQTLTTKMTTEL